MSRSETLFVLMMASALSFSACSKSGAKPTEGKLPCHDGFVQKDGECYEQLAAAYKFKRHDDLDHHCQRALKSSGLARKCEFGGIVDSKQFSGKLFAYTVHTVDGDNFNKVDLYVGVYKKSDPNSKKEIAASRKIDKVVQEEPASSDYGALAYCRSSTSASNCDAIDKKSVLMEILNKFAFSEATPSTKNGRVVADVKLDKSECLSMCAESSKDAPSADMKKMLLESCQKACK